MIPQGGMLAAALHIMSKGLLHMLISEAIQAIQDYCGGIDAFTGKPIELATTRDRNERTTEIVEDCGIKYCRTTKPTNNFELPKGIMLNPTCHFLASNLFELAEEFINAQYDDAKMFYIWGHSYELITEEDWTKFEEFCKLISGKSDIWYCTNIEVIDAIEE